MLPKEKEVTPMMCASSFDGVGSSIQYYLWNIEYSCQIPKPESHQATTYNYYFTENIGSHVKWHRGM